MVASGKPPGGRASSRRRPSHRLVKSHRNYEVEEAAKLLGVAVGTVRRWIKTGALPAIVDKKPMLILGGDLVDYLQSRSRPGPKMPLHQCYCFMCRRPRSPGLSMADYVPLTATKGNLRALCEVCTTEMHKVVALGALIQLEGILDLTIRQDEPHLIDVPDPSLNDHLQ
jgi:excisionase family DNA binding protein